MHRALEAAAVDYLEADLWLERGRLKVRHPQRLWPLPVYWEERRIFLDFRACPTLDEVAAAADGLRLYIDLKGTTLKLSDAVVDFVLARGIEDAVVFSSPEWALLDRVRERLNATCFYTLGKKDYEGKLQSILAGGFPYLAVNHSLLHRDVVARIKHAGSRMVAWTVNSLERARELISWGVDGVVSDEIDVLEAVKGDAGGAAST